MAWDTKVSSAPEKSNAHIQNSIVYTPKPKPAMVRESPKIPTTMSVVVTRPNLIRDVRVQGSTPLTSAHTAALKLRFGVGYVFASVNFI